MNSIYIIFLCVVTSAWAYFQDNGFNNFTYYATKVDSHTAMVCMMGAVPENTYIGIGIPNNGTMPFMLGADITMVYSSKNSVKMIHGHGIAVERPCFVTDKNLKLKTRQSLVKSESYYKNGVLKGCFHRKIILDKHDGNDLVVGSSG
ncbi:UNVERIFIED_CONTAM: hypothetical protein HDU68_012030 [Siphonaria sp. JEL0065]|nr:hypothetical protein HDU68_012030 [Siphonaria sp. JEL0065]